MMPTDDTPILAVAPADWYGVRRALSCYTPHIVTPDTAIATIDAMRPQTVLFGCYQPDWYNIVSRARFHRIRCVVTWFAGMVLNEFDVRNREWLYAALSAIRRGYLHEIATPHRGTHTVWQGEGLPSRYLPLAFTPPAIEITPRAPGVHLGLLGSGQPWKNMETQALAAQLVHRRRGDVTLHVQNDHALRSARRFFDIPTVVHTTRLSDEQYYQLVESMHVNLIVSLSETFSYLGAESLSLGTPILTTPITPLLDTADALLREHCIVTKFDDPVVIADHIEGILRNRLVLSHHGYAHMQSLNTTELSHIAKVRDAWTRPLAS